MAAATIHQILTAGLEHHKAGRLREAQAAYQQVLSQQPDHSDALHLLGVILHQQGRNDEGGALVRRAIERQPNQPIFYNNLALIQSAQERWEDAAVSCRQAISLNGNYVEARHTLGLALMGANRLAEAVESFRMALALQPDHADAYFNLGRVLCRTGPLEEAVSSCRRAVDLRPDRPEGWCNLGVALGKLARHADAESCYREALRRSPENASAWHKLAGCLMLSGQLDEAELACRRACELQPRSAELFGTLGNILKDQGRIDEAVARYRQSIALNPAAYPDYGSLLYSLHFHPGYDSRAIYQEHIAWNALQARPIEQQGRPHDNDRSPERRLRIGYVSPHFRNQATSFFTMPLLGAHDHARFEIYCYADVLRRDEVTAMLQKHADAWRDIVALPDEQVAQKILDDRIDILVDLTMHMADGRPFLFARKPAPVQVAWLAYPGTTGLAAMDYRLTDPHLDPPGANDAFYSEISYRLPGTALCYHPLASGPAVNSLPALSAGHITFGSMNHFAKANDSVLQMWANVLASVPDSRMLVLAPRGSPCKRFDDAVKAAGADPRRVEYLERASRQQYLQYFHRIDIILDTWPYNGETTSFDGLWMGVPMVTLCGSTAPSRAGLCYHTILGLNDFVAHTPVEFVQIASRVAGDLPRLGDLRRTLRERMEKSPLMDAPRFARNVEAAYRSMWRRWCSAP